MSVQAGTESSNRLRFLNFMTWNIKLVRLSALGTDYFTPKKYSCYALLLESVSTPGR